MHSWKVCKVAVLITALVVGLGSTIEKKPSSPRNDWDSQASLIRALGLSRDVNDQEILNLLADKQRRILAMGLIGYRKMSAAIPGLLLIAKDPNETVVGRISASQTLLGLGNKEWVPFLRPLIADPNSRIFITDKIKMAGLLAQSGDYSGIGILTSTAGDTRYFVRCAIVTELPHFVDGNVEIARLAVNQLYELAVSDRHPRVRAVSLESLRKVAGKKPELRSMLIEAAKRNADSNDVVLQTTAKHLLWQVSTEGPSP